MASLRQMALCIGLEDINNFRVVRDLFGYATGAPRALSLLEQARRLQGKHIHLNIIRVGADSFTNADDQELDLAIDYTREFYDQVNLGIGRIEWYDVSIAAANGAENINSDDEAQDLTNSWTVANGAIDVFFVLTYAGITAGRAPVDGPCNKDTKWTMTGCVVAIETGMLQTAQTLAHEVGHYLGLEHNNFDPANLMYGGGSWGIKLYSSQGATMRDHCFVDPGCA